MLIQQVQVYSFPLQNNETLLTSSSRTGECRDGDYVEIIDLVKEEGEDGDIQDADQVTETEVAQSELGKQPVFHHEIYERLVNLMKSQGEYSISLPTFYFGGCADPFYSLRASRPWY